VFDDFHSFDNLGERREPLGVQALIAGQIDEDLGRPRSGTLGSEGERAGAICLHDWIVLDFVIPLFSDRRSCGEAELHDKPRDHTKESRAVEEFCLYQLVELFGTQRRPIAMDFQDDRTFAGYEADLKRLVVCGRGRRGFFRCRLSSFGLGTFLLLIRGTGACGQEKGCENGEQQFLMVSHFCLFHILASSDNRISESLIAMHSDEGGSAESWQVPQLSGLQCFRASAITHEYGRHSHPGWAIGVIEKGVGGTLYRGVRESIHPGEIVAMNPEEAHTGYPANKQPLSYRMFYIEHSFFSDILVSGSAVPRFDLMRITDSGWAAKLRQAHDRLAQPPGLKEDTFLIETLREFAETYGNLSLRSPRGVEPVAVTRIKEFVRESFGRNVRIAELAALTGLDRAYLIRSFRRSVGMPPHEWLIQIRIAEAKRLLSCGRAIAEVAGEVGFADQSHLTRHFKSLTGLTPGQYVRGHFRSRPVR
jgi:AraC-like DNA-binding protein